MPYLPFPRVLDRTLVRMLLLSLSLHLALLMIVQPTRVREVEMAPPIAARLQLSQPEPEPLAPVIAPPVSAPEPPLPKPAPPAPEAVVPPPAPVADVPMPRETPLASEKAIQALPSPALVPAPKPAAMPALAPETAADSAKAAAKPSAVASVPPAASKLPLPSVPVMLDTTWYGARQLDAQPRLVRPVQPPYPLQARRRGVEGAVKLMLKIDEYGVVQEVQVEEGEPPGVFDAAALEAFRAARFVPAQKNQRPVRALVYVRVVFKLE